MHKKALLMAVAGLAAAPVFAQNVTIYGVADATFDVMNVSGGSVAANNVGAYNRLSTNSSLIGFKGNEDLGNGLKALFQFESAANFDNLGGFGANRDSYVGLSGGFGTVLAGNLTGPTRLLGAVVDVNAGGTGIGSNQALIGKLGNVLTGRLDSTNTTNTATGQVTNAIGRSSTQASVIDTRLANVVAYVSPTFNGFTVTGGYVANENKTGGAGQPNTSAYDLGLTYANGPIWAGIGHSDVSTKNITATNPTNTRLAAKYDFGVADVRVLWDSTKIDTNAGLHAKQNVWGIGTSIKAGAAGKFIAQYYKADDVKGSGLGAGANTGANFAEIGFEYSLSKRTLLKADYARLSNRSAASYDFAVNATGLSSGGATLSGLQVGLRHSF